MQEIELFFLSLKQSNALWNEEEGTTGIEQNWL